MRSFIDPADTNDGILDGSSLRDRWPICHACDAEGTISAPGEDILLNKAASCGLLDLIGTTCSLYGHGVERRDLNLQFI
jgi:hypothetical protein